MNTLKKHLLPAALVLLAVCSTHAQTLTRVLIGRTNELVQTDATTVSNDTSNPFGNLDWGVKVVGTGLSAPTITLAGATNNGTLNPTQHNGGVLGFNAGNNAWEYGSPNFNNIAMATGADRNARFPFGAYTVSVPGFTDVSLTQVSYSTTAAAFTLTGGTWSGGVYLVDPTQAVTISTFAAPFTDFSANANGAITFKIDPASGPALADTVRFYSDDHGADNFISYTIGANTLAAGTSYTVNGTYVAFLDQNSTNGSFNGAYYELSTSFTIQAIPEPASYAALVGLGALGLVTWHRRRPVTA